MSLSEHILPEKKLLFSRKHFPKIHGSAGNLGNSTDMTISSGSKGFTVDSVPALYRIPVGAAASQEFLFSVFPSL